MNNNNSNEELSTKAIIIQKNVKRYLIQKIVSSSKNEFMKIFHLIEGVGISDPVLMNWLSSRKLNLPKQNFYQEENESIKLKKTLTIEKIKILEMKLQLINQKIEDRKKELILNKEFF